MQKFLSLFIVGILVLPNMAAASPKEEAHLQLLAIHDYLVRIYDLESTDTLTSSEMRDTIRDGVTWIVNSQETNGHFKYEYAPYDDEYLEDDHIVRQAGTFFELGEVVRKDVDDTYDIDDTMEAAIDYFESLTESDEVSCITMNSVSKRCYLGATSLAVLGIMGYIERDSALQEKHMDLVETYIDFILSTQKENGGYRDSHIVGASTQSDKESAFSNGEALLALTRYYQINPREDVKEAIDTTFEYLKVQEYDTALYLWIMAALKDLDQMFPNDEYVTYGKAFTDWRVLRAQRFRESDKNFCAYTEGVVSAYSLLESSISDTEKAELRAEIDYWHTRLKSLQINDADTYRIIETDDGITLGKIKNMDLAYGGFLTGQHDLTQRIDYTQHCISAYLQTLVDIDGETL